MPAPDGDLWLHIGPEPLSPVDATAWAMRSDCGAVVTFLGTVRDHAEGRDGVVGLDYEAYLEPGRKRLSEIADGCRSGWPEIGRIAILHRLGHLEVTDISVVVVVSSPHRHVAFEAARFAIDTVKSSVPIWKKETWLSDPPDQDRGGGASAGAPGPRVCSDWATGAQPVSGVPAPPVSGVPAPPVSGVPDQGWPDGVSDSEHERAGRR